MKIRELPDWPPSPGGSYHWTHRTPASDQAVLKALVRVQDDWVVFTSTFEGKEQTYDFQTPSAAMAKNLAEIVQGNAGKKTVMEMGELEL